tara:strand:- start:705 stop:1934 length:1230 start_codon:yes stop_codon:yes gene_type:complete
MTKKLNFLINNQFDIVNFKNYQTNKIKVKKNIETISKNINYTKNIFYSFSKNFKYTFSINDLKKFQKYKVVIIIGMGGSSLGSKAVYSFLKHKVKKKFIFFENLDVVQIQSVKKKYNFKNSLFIIISKSGTTHETLLNFSVLKSNNINNKNTIIITEKNNNQLYQYSKKEKISLYEHRNFIGGRYSVFTEVAMLPAQLMGLNTKALSKYSQDYLKGKKKKHLIDNVSKIKYFFTAKNMSSIILLNFCPQLNDFLFWCQQLIAESLGKKGQGLLPVVSSAPKDHHSLLQLYLDGPKDKLFYIFSADKKSNIFSKKNLFGPTFSITNKEDLTKIINAQKDAIKEALKDKKIPFREFTISSFDEKVLGELFSYFMLETYLIGKLMGINPLDQPAVEKVKILTKKNLLKNSQK